MVMITFVIDVDKIKNKPRLFLCVFEEPSDVMITSNVTLAYHVEIAARSVPCPPAPFTNTREKYVQIAKLRIHLCTRAAVWRRRGSSTRCVKAARDFGN